MPDTKKPPELPVWFYIGALSAVYGILLTGAGLYQLGHPPVTVLSDLHATLWAGLILLAVGLVYLICFWPRRHL